MLQAKYSGHAIDLCLFAGKCPMQEHPLSEYETMTARPEASAGSEIQEYLGERLPAPSPRSRG